MQLSSSGDNFATMVGLGTWSVHTWKDLRLSCFQFALFNAVLLRKLILMLKLIGDIHII